MSKLMTKLPGIFWYFISDKLERSLIVYFLIMDIKVLGDCNLLCVWVCVEVCVDTNNTFVMPSGKLVTCHTGQLCRNKKK